MTVFWLTAVSSGSLVTVRTPGSQWKDRRYDMFISEL